MQIPSPIVLDSFSDSLTEQLGALSTAAGALCVEVAGRVTYLSSTTNLRRRAARMMDRLRRPDSQQKPRQALAIHCWESGSKLHTSLLVYQLAKRYFPQEYLKRVHLRMPWFLALLTHDPFPRLLVTNRIPQGDQAVFGPFARRDLAQLYEQELQGGFLLRRCSEDLSPHPEHPGCIYGEMNQCLRPCQGVVDRERYLFEATEVCGFLGENGGSVVRKIAQAREQAVADLNFEGAARIHKRLEKLNAAKGFRDPVIANVNNFNGMALVRQAKSAQAQIFPMVHGRWREPVDFTEADAFLEMRELESELRKQFDLVSLEAEQSGGNRLEDLALFARWYYSSWREGIWVPFARLDDPPYRKIARSLRSLLKGGHSTVREPSLLGP